MSVLARAKAGQFTLARNVEATLAVIRNLTSQRLS
jgi:hypothetical protein